MKYSSNYSDFLDDQIADISLDDSKKQLIKKEFLHERTAHDKNLEDEFNLSTKKWISIIIGILFVLSYVILIAMLVIVFFNEVEMINAGTLKASDRSVNAQVIMVLIAGTITQTALSFVALTKYFFLPKNISAISKTNITKKSS